MSVKGKNGAKFPGRLPDDREIRKEVDKMLERMGKAAVKAFQDEVRRSSWNKSPKALIDSFEYEVKDGTLHIRSDHPAATYLNKGVRPHQMIYLEKAKKPIPIITDSGKVVFRTPSSQTMRNGQWKHPGISGKHFMQRGQEKAKEALRKELGKTYSEIFRKALKA